MKRLSYMLLGFTMLAVAACSQSHTAPKTVAINTPLPAVLTGDAAIVGTCLARDRSVLPGVTVTISDNAGHSQTAVTNAQSGYAFRMILPGKYSVRWELVGYGMATRLVTIAAGKTADVTGTLNPSMFESITVTAEAPLLD